MGLEDSRVFTPPRGREINHSPWVTFLPVCSFSLSSSPLLSLSLPLLFSLSPYVVHIPVNPPSTLSGRAHPVMTSAIFDCLITRTHTHTHVYTDTDKPNPQTLRQVLLSVLPPLSAWRSEERRVGKECRSRLS